MSLECLEHPIKYTCVLGPRRDVPIPLSNSMDPQPLRLLSRLPQADDPAHPLPPHLEMFFFPDGEPMLRDSAGDVTVLHSVFTELEGTHLYATAITFWDPVQVQLPRHTHYSPAVRRLSRRHRRVSAHPELQQRKVVTYRPPTQPISKKASAASPVSETGVKFVAKASSASDSTAIQDLVAQRSESSNQHRFRVRWAPVCLCLVSTWPIFNAMAHILTHTYAATHGSAMLSAPSIGAYLGVFMKCVYMPPPDLLHYTVRLDVFPTFQPCGGAVSTGFTLRRPLRVNDVWAGLPCMETLVELCKLCDGPEAMNAGSDHDGTTLQAPVRFVLPSCPFDIMLLFQLLRPSHVVQIITALLCEHRVVLVSHDRTALPIVGQMLQALLYPFTWNHVYIPCLPVSLVDLLSAPTPFLVGLPSSYITNGIVDMKSMGDCVVCDIDVDCLLCPHSNAALLPWTSLLELRLAHELRAPLTCLGRVIPAANSPPSRDSAYRIRLCFVRFFAELFWGYRRHIIFLQRQPQVVLVFDSEGFIDSKDCFGLREFMAEFINTHAWQRFLETYATPLCSRLHVFHMLTSVLQHRAEADLQEVKRKARMQRLKHMAKAQHQQAQQLRKQQPRQDPHGEIGKALKAEGSGSSDGGDMSLLCMSALENAHVDEHGDAKDDSATGGASGSPAPVRRSRKNSSRATVRSPRWRRSRMTRRGGKEPSAAALIGGDNSGPQGSASAAKSPRGPASQGDGARASGASDAAPHDPALGNASAPGAVTWRRAAADYARCVQQAQSTTQSATDSIASYRGLHDAKQRLVTGLQAWLRNASVAQVRHQAQQGAKKVQSKKEEKTGKQEGNSDAAVGGAIPISDSPVAETGFAALAHATQGVADTKVTARDRLEKACEAVLLATLQAAATEADALAYLSRVEQRWSRVPHTMTGDHHVWTVTPVEGASIGPSESGKAPGSREALVVQEFPCGDCLGVDDESSCTIVKVGPAGGIGGGGGDDNSSSSGGDGDASHVSVPLAGADAGDTDASEHTVLWHSFVARQRARIRSMPGVALLLGLEADEQDACEDDADTLVDADMVDTMKAWTLAVYSEDPGQGNPSLAYDRDTLMAEMRRASTRFFLMCMLTRLLRKPEVSPQGMQELAVMLDHLLSHVPTTWASIVASGPTGGAWDAHVLLILLDLSWSIFVRGPDDVKLFLKAKLARHPAWMCGEFWLWVALQRLGARLPKISHTLVQLSRGLNQAPLGDGDRGDTDAGKPTVETLVVPEGDVAEIIGSCGFNIVFLCPPGDAPNILLNFGKALLGHAEVSSIGSSTNTATTSPTPTTSPGTAPTTSTTMSNKGHVSPTAYPIPLGFEDPVAVTRLQGLVRSMCTLVVEKPRMSRSSMHTSIISNEECDSLVAHGARNTSAAAQVDSDMAPQAVSSPAPLRSESHTMVRRATQSPVRSRVATLVMNSSRSLKEGMSPAKLHNYIRTQSSSNVTNHDRSVATETTASFSGEEEDDEEDAEGMEDVHGSSVDEQKPGEESVEGNREDGEDVGVGQDHVVSGEGNARGDGGGNDDTDESGESCVDSDGSKDGSGEKIHSDVVGDHDVAVDVVDTTALETPSQ